MTKSTHKAAVAGVVVALMAALAPAVSYAAETITNAPNTGTTGSVGFGTLTGRQQVAAYFTTTSGGKANGLTVCIAKSSSPTDNAVLALQADSGGSPSGTDLDTASILGSSLLAYAGSCRDEVLAFSDTVSLAASTKYWLVWKRSGSLDDTNAYIVGGSGTNPTNSNQKAYTGSWAAANADGTWRFILVLDNGPVIAQVATSSIDQTQNDVWQAYWVFFTMFCLMLWLGRSVKS